MSPAPGVPSTWTDLLRTGGAARVGVADVAEVDTEEWAAESDLAVLSVDTQDCATEQELIAALAEAFSGDPEEVVEWVDLDDLLADHDVAPATGLVVLWTGWDGLDEDPDHVIPVAVDAFVTAAGTWADEDRPWAVLIVGDGPSWDLPWLGAGEAPWEAEDRDDLDDPDEDEDWSDVDEVAEGGSDVGDEEFEEADDESGDRLPAW